MKRPGKTSKPADMPEADPTAHAAEEDPIKTAWTTAFFIENHLDHFSYPEQAASAEQTRFMVYTEENERYYPCSDRMFEAIVNQQHSDYIQDIYRRALARVLAVVEQQIEDPHEKAYLTALIKIKFEHETRDNIMIPSRVEKRLIRIFLNGTQISDPWLPEKMTRNFRAQRALQSSAFQQAVNIYDLHPEEPSPATLTALREKANLQEFQRLLALSVENSLWESDPTHPFTPDDFKRMFDRPINGNGVAPMLRFLGIQKHVPDTRAPRPQKILWLANEAGELIVDLAIIRFLVKLGHKIIVAFRDGPLFNKVDFEDAQGDETLKNELRRADLITEKRLSKNQLVTTLRRDNHILAVSDGTREILNLLLTTTTFARIFKEVDGVISRGPEQRRRFFSTHFQFTQDIYNISKGPDGSVEIRLKPKHPSVIKFSHADLENKAQAIVDQMAAAKNQGMTVIFYSGIIGSLPGKIHIAKKLMTVFIQHLKEQSAMTFIINPSNYYEPGMDADDLMYMWEIVQRSGLIDIWRFQTYEDIAQGFKIMGQKVPPEWVGKDATFSTGCTKEMKIALDVVKKYPEMQIIGPSREKFMRREEYGVGKMYDQKFCQVQP